MADLKNGLLLTNELITRYFGTDENDYFYVELVARRPKAADFQGTPQQLRVSSKEGEVEARFKIIFSNDSYPVTHTHNWGEGGLGHTVKKGIEGAGIKASDLQNLWSTFQTFGDGKKPDWVDERTQFGNLDVPQIYMGSNRGSMEIQFVLFRYGEDNEIVKQVNEIRNLTYPSAGTEGMGGALSFAGSFRYGQPPCIWTVKCSNGAQGMKKAGCSSISVQYNGPWVGTKGQPTYATVTMGFTSLYEMTFAQDFLGDGGEFS